MARRDVDGRFTVDVRDRAALAAALGLALPKATVLTVNMCWHHGSGHDYPPAVLTAAGRLRERHGSRDMDEEYTALTFAPSQGDLQDFIEVAAYCDLAYANDENGEEIAEVSGEDVPARVLLTSDQQDQLRGST